MVNQHIRQACALSVLAHTSGNVLAQTCHPVTVNHIGAKVTDAKPYGDFVLAGLRSSKVLVIDASNPAEPSVAGRFDVSSNTYRIEIANDSAYILTQDSLSAFDISSLPDAQFLWSYPKGGRSLASDGQRLFVRTFEGRLLVFDIQIPSQPLLLLDQPTPWTTVGWSGQSFYSTQTSEPSRLAFWDTSDLNNLQLTESVQLSGTAGYAYDIGERRYTLSTYGVRVYQDRTNYFDFSSIGTPGICSGLAVGDGLLFTTDTLGWGLAAISYREPGTPQLGLVANVPESLYLTEPFFINGSVGYSAAAAANTHSETSSVNFAAFDFDGTFSKIGSIEFFAPSFLTDVAIIGKDTLVVSSNYLLRIIDPNSELPAVERLLPSIPVTDILASESAVVARSYGAFYVLNPSDPGQILSTIAIENAFRLESADLVGNYLSVAYSQDLAILYDLTSPDNPVEVVRITTDRTPVAATTLGPYFVIGSTSSTQIYDLSNPDSPMIIHEEPGQNAYVKSNGSVLHTGSQSPATFRLHDGVPEKVSEAEYAGIPLAFLDDRYLLTSLGGELGVVDTYRPGCSALHRLDLNYTVSNVFVDADGLVYIAARGDGLVVMDFEPCLLPSCPANFGPLCDRLDFADVSAFIDLFNDAHPAADFNQDGSINVFDLFNFVESFLIGCDPRAD